MHFWKRRIKINGVSILFVTIVSTTILYWTNITLSKMASFDKWYQKPETKAQLASAKKNAWEQITKQFPNADKDRFFVQESVAEKYRISAEVFFKENAEDSSSVFGSDRKYWSQKKEDCSWFDRRRRLPFPAIAIKNKNSTTNSSSRVHRTGAKHCKNIQQREQNLCNARRIFRDKISRHISANQAEAHHIC